MSTNPPPEFRIGKAWFRRTGEWASGTFAVNASAARVGLRWAHEELSHRYKVTGGLFTALVFVQGFVGLFVSVGSSFTELGRFMDYVEPTDLVGSILTLQALLGAVPACILALVAVVGSLALLSLVQATLSAFVALLDLIVSPRNRPSAIMPDGPLQGWLSLKIARALGFPLAQRFAVLCLMAPCFIGCSYGTNLLAATTEAAKESQVTVCLSNRTCPVARLSKLTDTSRYLVGTQIKGMPATEACRFDASPDPKAITVSYIGRSEVRRIFPGKPDDEKIDYVGVCTRLQGPTTDLTTVVERLDKIIDLIRRVVFPPPSDLAKIESLLIELRQAIGTANEMVTIVSLLTRIDAKMAAIDKRLEPWDPATTKTLEAIAAVRAEMTKAVTTLDKIEVNTRPKGDPRFAGCDRLPFGKIAFQFALGKDNYNAPDPESSGNVSSNESDLVNAVNIMDVERQKPDFSHFLVVGEASALGTPTANLELSQRRALKICAGLKGKLYDKAWSITCADANPPIPSLQAHGGASPTQTVRVVTVPVGEGFHFEAEDPSGRERRRVWMMSCKRLPPSFVKSG